jgi:hypothetical protein
MFVAVFLKIQKPDFRKLKRQFITLAICDLLFGINQNLLKENNMIQKLEKKFIGGGEVLGFDFEQVHENEHGYVYKVSTDGAVHFESFFKKTVPVCIDFAKKIFSETDRKEVYPKSPAFGVWAITTSCMGKAINFLNEKQA